GEDGPITVRMRDAEPDALSIAVHNFGAPIPPDAQAHVFDAFYREETTDDGDSTSIGLGLFIAHEIVRGHGGSIALPSTDRDGTTFTIWLPRKPAAAVGRDTEALPPTQMTKDAAQGDSGIVE